MVAKTLPLIVEKKHSIIKRHMSILNILGFWIKPVSLPISSVFVVYIILGPPNSWSHTPNHDMIFAKPQNSWNLSIETLKDEISQIGDRFRVEILGRFSPWDPLFTQVERELAVPWPKMRLEHVSRWWQLEYFLFSPLSLGEMIHFDSYFSNGLKPPTRCFLFGSFLFCSKCSWHKAVPQSLSWRCLLWQALGNQKNTKRVNPNSQSVHVEFECNLYKLCFFLGSFGPFVDLCSNLTYGIHGTNHEERCMIRKWGGTPSFKDLIFACSKNPQSKRHVLQIPHKTTSQRV